MASRLQGPAESLHGIHALELELDATALKQTLDQLGVQRVVLDVEDSNGGARPLVRLLGVQ
ncbi:MAG: hypothetical protein HY901_12235 [Deltaproteobacteria bacterium]|nr:hypothetical protein [Deltaproteobacteria bacterium]